MLRNLLLRLAPPRGASILSSHLGRLTAGCAAGVVLSQASLQWLISQGTGVAAWLTLSLAAVAGLALGLVAPLPARLDRRWGCGVAGGLALLLASGVLPPLLTAVVDWLWNPARMAPEMTATTFVWLWCAAGLVTGLPIALATWVVRSASDQPSGRFESLPLAGVGLGLLAHGGLLAPWWGLWTSGLLLCGLALPGLGWAAWRAKEDAGELPSGETAGGDRPFWQGLAAVLACFLAGATLVAQQELWAHLAPVTAQTVVGLLTGGMWGASLGLLCGRGLRRVEATPILAAGWLTLSGLGLYLAFPVFLDWQLSLQGSGAAVGWQMLCRLAVPALFAMAVVFAASLWLTASHPTGWGERAWQFAAALAGLCGCLMATLLLPTLEGPRWILTGAAVLAMLCVLPTAWRLRTTLPRSVRLAGAVPVCVVLLAALLSNRYDAPRAARVLFSSQSLSAHAGGFADRLLPWLDEARLVSQKRDLSGEWTAWKYAGHQVQIRQNGIPKGVLSIRPDIFPRHASDTLAAVLPLVLHERPRRMLMLGLASGEALGVALQHPLERIVCTEANPALVDLVQQLQAQSHAELAGADLLVSEKLTWQRCEPLVGLATETEPADVIVSLPDSLAQLQSQVNYTRQFYTLAARRLTSDGIFCQRVQMFDYGPAGLQWVLRTMREVFPQVMLLEASPGEFLCLGTYADGGFVRGRLVRRCEATHVRNLLGQCGFDWSTLFRLPALDSEATGEFAAAGGTVGNSADAGWLALRMPRELVRWGNKIEETQMALSPLVSQLQTWLPGGRGLPELERRVGEVQSQQDLMARFTNQYWAYRATLRDQVSKKSRSQLQPVTLAEQRRMHPEDRRRLAYFEILGRAVKTRAPEDIERLAGFETPYDPLVSYFLHQEAAELLRTSSSRDVVRELEHRLHTTWFSSARDASLRNVIAALDLLCEHPAATQDAWERWDQFNGLLQALQRRWSVRAQLKPSTARSLVADADQTLLSVRKTFDTMEQLAPQLGIPAEDWAARREVLDQTLVRLVQSQKNQWLPQALRRREFGVDEPETTNETPAPAPLLVPTAPSSISEAPAADLAVRDEDEE